MSFEEKVIAVLASVISIDEIERTDVLKELGVDSLKIVEVMLLLEETFTIRFKDSELDPSHLVTVNDLIELVRNHE